MSELRHNIFREEIVSQFVNAEGFMSFENFLTMASIFSSNADFLSKLKVAFKIYGLYHYIINH